MNYMKIHNRLVAVGNYQRTLLFSPTGSFVARYLCHSCHVTLLYCDKQMTLQDGGRPRSDVAKLFLDQRGREIRWDVSQSPFELFYLLLMSSRFIMLATLLFVLCLTLCSTQKQDGNATDSASEMSTSAETLATQASISPTNSGQLVTDKPSAIHLDTSVEEGSFLENLVEGLLQCFRDLNKKIKVGRGYRITSIKTLNTRFGRRVLVVLDGNCNVWLPNHFLLLTDAQVEDTAKVELMLVYKGISK
uniref:Uncharacterized protein n=1 Tax=Timema cristinae TaxID=61476 RepID=A0A7R9CMJ3_TIMCR|nr:unnamed protein product [Timema cristinae]